MNSVDLMVITSIQIFPFLNQAYGSLYHPAQYIQHNKEPEQDLHKIPGIPGHDYPIYHEVPPTSFHCANVPAIPGMYANVETGCQAYQ